MLCFLLKYYGIVISLNLRVLEASNAFIFIDPNLTITSQLFNYCHRFRLSAIISEDSIAQGIVASYPISDCLFLTKFSRGFNFDNAERILYSIQTSGSTGEPKVVCVYESAIMANIADFR